jgi:hypothetical protein
MMAITTSNSMSVNPSRLDIRDIASPPKKSQKGVKKRAPFPSPK